jgi:hypothetical protein
MPNNIWIFLMKLVSFDHSRFNVIKESWLKELTSEDHDAARIEYEQIFNIIEASSAWGELDDIFNKPIFQSVVCDDDYVWALVEIVQSKVGSEIWVKMLDITLCPKIDILLESEESTSDRLRVFTAALIGIFNLTKDTRLAKTIKVFGRTDVLVTFLRGMHSALTIMESLGAIPGISVTIEGRWLVFKPAK